MLKFWYFALIIFLLRTIKYYQPKSIEDFKKKLLFWAQQFDDVVWLDSNNDNQKYSSYDSRLTQLRMKMGKLIVALKRMKFRYNKQTKLFQAVKEEIITQGKEVQLNR